MDTAALPTATGPRATAFHLQPSEAEQGLGFSKSFDQGKIV